ncbi:MAG: galactofuranosyltransferase [Bacteroidaceae bacterium]|nr:galactofuranosyltransferase [Bacteroidaceae bacterium]
MFCYISHNYRNLTSAGNKAKSDIEKIMQREGFKNVGLRQTHFKNDVLSFLLTLCGVLKVPFCLHRGDVLVLQYPLKKYYTLLCRFAHLRGAKVVTIIHDLGAFRRKRLSVEQETLRLSHTDFLICHNENMKAHLRKNGCKMPIHSLGIFDYLSEKNNAAPMAPHQPYSVVYAGGLARGRSKFLYQLDPIIHHYTLSLYGAGLDTEEAAGWKRVDYRGYLPSEEFIGQVEADFGLVWDGSSLDACDGAWGEYLKINNPHKTSFYLRAGIPVIVWREAAMVPFVEAHGVGLVVSSLRELDSRLENLTEADYATLRKNAQEMARRLADGYFVKQALEKADDYFDMKKYE